MSMKQIQAIKADLAKALAAYHAIVHTAPAAEVKDAADAVKLFRRALSDAICEGASPCPTCGADPIGLEQPKAKGGVEFEIGCPSCRDTRVRGGLLPKHAVEAWNEGAFIGAVVNAAAKS